ncbi:MAG: Hsp33 family molecular chaperone [Pseudomonadota bacterium]
MTDMTKSQADPFGSAVKLAGDDRVVPFQVSPLDIRGRAIQLGPMLNSILDRHDYPAPVAALLGEAIVLTVLLGTSLKFEGKFIFQTQSEGPVSLLVVDYRTPDAVRAHARFDEELVAAAMEAGDVTSEALLGNGTLAMTIDQGNHMQRYQGIVELNGISLEEAAMQYFRQSEQIPTIVRLAAAEISTPGIDGKGFQHSMRAGGMVVQFLPEASDRIMITDLPGGDLPEDVEIPDIAEEDDAWAETRALLGTITDDELTDPQIGSERLLFRLFHEHGVHVFEGEDIADKCSCSREKIAEVIRSLDEDELAEAFEDGVITTTCEFCSTVYKLTSEDL